MLNKKVEKRIRRHKRVRAKINGTANRPRIAVFKSNTSLYVQVIDDSINKTIIGIKSKQKNGSRMQQAEKVGKEIAEAMKKSKLNEAVFDRGGFNYTGVIKKLADTIRDNGIKV